MKFSRIKYQEQVEQLTKSHDSDAGLDIATNMDYLLRPGERKVFTTGIRIAVPEGHYGRVACRSGLYSKHGVKSFHGTVDHAYRGELKVILYNTGHTPYAVTKGERIAQLLTVPCNIGYYEEVDELDDTERGENGFGSTGTV